MKKEIFFITSVVMGCALSSIGTMYINKRHYERQSAMPNKNRELFMMMNQWVNAKQDGKSIAEYLEYHGYKKIAIYGMSYVGRTLLKELEDSSVSVLYGIDRNAEGMPMDIEVVLPNTSLKEVDAVIVTAVAYFDEIEEVLSKKMECPIICLDEIISEM